MPLQYYVLESKLLGGKWCTLYDDLYVTKCFWIYTFYEL